LSGATVAAGAAHGRIAARIAALREARFAERLLAADPTLWGGDPARHEAVARRLGWVRSAEAMLARAGEYTAFAREVAAEGFTRVLLLGMGGSSLAPEVIAGVHGVRPGGLPLAVLDDTSPAAVRAVLAAGDPARTLHLVASKSGGTIEVTSFERACFARAAAGLGPRAGRSFAAITDPGTALESHARARGYRAVFTNPADIGGRYSALSGFGLLPAALLGLDPAALCRSALEELAAFEAGGGAALEAGAALGELALAGRDKLTLVLPPGWTPLGAWIEQLVAESTGKQGRGILPVDGEPLAGPEAYGDDRVFVALEPQGAGSPADSPLARLAAAGHPVLRWSRPGVASLGAEFLRWELVTAVAGAVIGVNPFDEPNVAEAKAATQQVLAAGGAPAAAAPRVRSGPLELYAPAPVPVDGPDERAWAGTLLALVRPGDYMAILAWAHRTPSRAAALDRLRAACRRATRAAVTLGHGPRYLHSTGQLHKGGGGNGVFLQLTCHEGDEPIPGEAHGFATLRAAQAAGDFEVLARHARRVVRVHVSGDPDLGLARLVEAFEQVAASRR
jgi:glucose-6-phosphate isomerase